MAALKILHLEDEALDSELVLELLRAEGLEVELERVATLPAFEEALQRRCYALVLSDYTIPGVNPLEALRLARLMCPEMAFIFVSGTIGEDRAIEAMRLGASDYVLKQRMERLVPAVRRALREAQEQARRRQAEQALRENERRMRAMFEYAGVGIVEVTGEDRFIAANARACEILGRSLEELLQINVHELTWHEEWELSDKLNAAVHSGASERVTYEKRYIRGDGSPVWCHVNVSAVRDDQGQWMRSITTIEDITERKRAEAAAQQAREELAQANAQLERKVQERTAQLVEANTNLQAFAYTAAHDLRSPLRSIRNFSGMVLEEGSNLDPENRSLLERVVGSAEQMQRLLTDLLEYSKLSQAELKLEPLNLRQAANEALALLEADIRAKNALVTVAEPLPGVMGHQATLVLIINNLVANALKFMAAGVQPQICISAELVDGGESRVDRPETGSSAPLPSGYQPSTINYPRVRLWVRDNGIGIAPEYWEKIFGAFERLHGKQAYPGTGLGLAIVRKGAERMDGRVGVESEVGRGSRFWVELRSAQ